MARQRIELQPEKAGELRRRVRASTVSMRDRRRSEIILLSAEGLTQQQIAKRMGRRFCIRSGNALEFVKSKPFDCTTRSGGGQQ